MKKLYILVVLSVFSFVFSQTSTSSEFWTNYTEDEKIAFINGVYGTVAKLKAHHKAEVKKQYLHDDNWIEPYYIERFYEIANEYYSKEVGYDLKIISMHMDAFYTNSDNSNIPILEALRIVSLLQDGERRKANSRLLRSQKKYKQ